VKSGKNKPVLTITSEEQWLTSFRFLDKYGRTIQSFNVGHLNDQNLTFTNYDFSSKVLKSRTLHQMNAGTINTIDKRIEYDSGNRVIGSYLKLNDGDEYKVSGLTLNETGILINKSIYDNQSLLIQKVDFAYNVRGWLKKKEYQNSDGTKGLFEMQLFYNDLLQTVGFQRQYNGNISGISWESSLDGEKRGFGYIFDGFGQLTNAIYGEGSDFSLQTTDYYNAQFTYDPNGNIQTAQRYGEGTLIDNLDYNYDPDIPNRLMTVEDAVTGSDKAIHFVDYGANSHSSREYEYDLNGNMTVDLNKAIQVEYNALNLPISVEFDDGGKIVWLYSADGTKLRKEVYRDGQLNYYKDYTGGFVYRSGELDYFRSENGRIRKVDDGFVPEYHIKDHLGNVRVAFESDGRGGVSRTQEQHYYPFGMEMPGLTLNSASENEYRYNNKEHEKDFALHWYHYGARYYDYQLGKWFSVDPKDFFHSTYLYVHNNPVGIIDPDGKAPTYLNEAQKIVYIDLLTKLVSTLEGNSQKALDLGYSNPSSLACSQTATVLYLETISKMGLKHKFKPIPTGGPYQFNPHGKRPKSDVAAVTATRLCASLEIVQGGNNWIEIDGMRAADIDFTKLEGGSIIIGIVADPEGYGYTGHTHTVLSVDSEFELITVFKSTHGGIDESLIEIYTFEEYQIYWGTNDVMKEWFHGEFTD
jgi:RHS repeat-associated protein